MRVNYFRKGCALALALLVIAGSLFAPAAFITEEGNSPYAAKYNAYADEYMWLQVRSIGGLSLMQSSTKEIVLSVTNTRDGNFTFDEATLEFEDKAGVTFKGGVSAETNFKASGDSTEIRFDITASRFCETGMKDFRLVLKNDGETVYTSRYFALSITENVVPGEEEEHGGVYINTVDVFHSIYPESGLVTGKGNTVSFQVFNGSSTSLRSAKIELSLPAGIAIDNGSPEKYLGNIGSGDAVTATFKIVVEEGVADKNHVIGVKVTGLDSKKEEVSFDKNFYVPVDGDGEIEDDGPDSVHTPILMVNNYNYGGGNVLAGSAFPLEISFLNTSKVNLYNIKVVVEGGGVFVPVNSSNAFYLESVGAGETVTHTITLSVSGDAKQDALPVNVSMTYENKDGDSFSAEDTISIPVVQELRLFIDSIVPPFEAYVGMETSASVDFYNMGKNTISNLRVTAEGNFDVYQSNSKYFGNFQSGAKDDYRFTVIPREVGTVSGTVTFTYEDMAGNTQTEVMPFSFEAMEMPVFEDPWAEMEPEPVKDAIPWGLIIGIVVFVVIVIGAIVTRKILKKKKEKALELEDALFEIDEADEGEKENK